MKKIWILMFTVVFLFGLFSLFQPPVTAPIGALVITQQQPASSSPAITADLIANTVSILFLLAMVTIFFTTALFARHSRRSRNYLLPFSPGLNKRAQLNF